jgi:hypothetical protein
VDKADGTDADIAEWIKLEFLMDPDNPASKYSQQFAIFKDGCPEDWIKWVMAFWKIENLMPMKEPADKTMIIQTLLKRQALSYFGRHLMRKLETEDSEISENELIELVLRDVGLEYIPEHPHVCKSIGLVCFLKCTMQKYYMRQGLYMGLNTSVQQFVERLNDLNRYLLNFPAENPKQLDEYEILEILDQAKALDPEWHEAMVNANIGIFEMSHEESVSYFKRFKNLEKIRRTNGPNPSSLPVDNENTVSVTSSVVGNFSKNHEGSNMWCHYCDKNNHKMADCRTIAKFKQQKYNKVCFGIQFCNWHYFYNVHGHQTSVTNIIDGLTRDTKTVL